MEQGASSKQARGATFGKPLTIHPGGFILIQFFNPLHKQHLLHPLLLLLLRMGPQEILSVLPPCNNSVCFNTWGSLLSCPPLDCDCSSTFKKGICKTASNPIPPNTKSRAI